MVNGGFDHAFLTAREVFSLPSVAPFTTPSGKRIKRVEKIDRADHYRVRYDVDCHLDDDK
jgi:hypothetical protein